MQRRGKRAQGMGTRRWPLDRSSTCRCASSCGRRGHTTPCCSKGASSSAVQRLQSMRPRKWGTDHRRGCFWQRPQLLRRAAFRWPWPRLWVRPSLALGQAQALVAALAQLRDPTVSARRRHRRRTAKRPVAGLQADQAGEMPPPGQCCGQWPWHRCRRPHWLDSRWVQWPRGAAAAAAAAAPVVGVEALDAERRAAGPQAQEAWAAEAARRQTWGASRGARQARV
mmetsp:Transcript_51680/g.130672  ORF Transcript_51680/g.130672 Transcript_51680/m.130672 type:complete len:225 (-) Transcript_51680:310-984(-)